MPAGQIKENPSVIPPEASVLALDPRRATFVNVLHKDSLLSTLDAFRLYVKTCQQAYRNNADDGFYAPYLALVQGSGSGKTTLVLNCGDESFFMLYLCLRPGGPDASGLPARTPIAADYFLKIKNKEECFAFYVAVFKGIRSLLSTDVFQDQQHRGSLLKQLQQNCMKAEFWTHVVQELVHRDDFCTEMDVEKSCTECWSVHPLCKHDPPLLLFAIDEARAMCDVKPPNQNMESPKPDESLFTIWQRSTQVNNVKWFFVVVDTAAKVGNFFPTYKHDPSARVSDQSLSLVPPFHVFPFTGPWSANEIKPYREWLGVKEILETKEMVWTPFWDLVQHSRPLFWSILVNSPLNDAKMIRHSQMWEELMSMAKTKLGLKADNRSFAILCYRFGLSPSDRRAAEQLLSSNGASLISVKPSDGIPTVRYVPEPVFGEAAAQGFASNRVPLLLELAELVSNGLIGRAYGKGDKGELAGLVYLTLVMDGIQLARMKHLRGSSSDESASSLSTDVLKASPVYSRPVRLLDFVCGLTGLTAEDMEADHGIARLLGAVVLQRAVAFTAWSDTKSSPTPACLSTGFQKRIGWVLAPGEAASDLLIPLSSLTNIQDSDWSIAAVQMKNWADDINRSQAVQLCRAQIKWAEKEGLLQNATKMVSILLLSGEGRLVGTKANSNDRAVLFQLDGHLCIVLNGFSSHFADGDTVQDILCSLRGDAAHMSTMMAANRMVVSKASKVAKEPFNKSTLQALNSFAVNSLSHLSAWPELARNIPVQVNEADDSIELTRTAARTSRMSAMVTIIPNDETKELLEFVVVKF